MNRFQRKPLPESRNPRASVYGAFDFVIGPDDTWTFLEVNAGGQYGWIEEATGAPITGQLAELLTKGNQ